MGTASGQLVGNEGPSQSRAVGLEVSVKSGGRSQPYKKRKENVKATDFNLRDDDYIYATKHTSPPELRQQLG